MKVAKRFRFEAAHVLPKHIGKCSRLHGHSYHGFVEVEGDIDEETGMVVDFNVLSAAIKLIIDDKLDHQFLNDVFIERGWDGETTAEMLAYHLFDDFALAFANVPAQLKRIRLYETEKCFVEIEATEMPYDE